AACVFGGARLISSASRRLVKIGPGRNSKSDSRWLKIEEPVTSDGIRSGVNWMRVKPMLVTWANARAISVFASPGKSSIRTWPSASSPSRTSWSAPRLPTTALSTSVRIRSDRSASSPIVTRQPSDGQRVDWSFQTAEQAKLARPEIDIASDVSLNRLQAVDHAPESRGLETRQEPAVGCLPVRAHDSPQLVAERLLDARVVRVEAEAAPVRQPLLGHLAQDRPEPEVEVERRRGGQGQQALGPLKIGRSHVWALRPLERSGKGGALLDRERPARGQRRRD